MNRYIHFHSDHFKPDQGEDEEVNPGIYGKKLAMWLNDELPKYGIDSNRIYAEDWGWEIDISTDNIRRFIGVRNVDETDNEWVVSIDIKNKILKKLFRKLQNEEDEVKEVMNRLSNILKKNDNITGLDLDYKL